MTLLNSLNKKNGTHNKMVVGSTCICEEGGGKGRLDSANTFGKLGSFPSTGQNQNHWKFCNVEEIKDIFAHS